MGQNPGPVNCSATLRRAKQELLYAKSCTFTFISNENHNFGVICNGQHLAQYLILCELYNSSSVHIHVTAVLVISCNFKS